MTRPRVVIIGAGLGGLSAAWHLTSTRPDLDVEIYEASWVPGGKAVSGRSFPEPAFGRPHEIEEHGLHMLFGTYHETWRMLGDCYRELKRPVTHAFRHIEQAFTPQRRIGFDERGPTHGERRHWSFCPAEHPDNPWDVPDTPRDDHSLLQQVAPALEAKCHELATVARTMYGPVPLSYAPSSFAPAWTGPSASLGAVPTNEALRTWARQTGNACAHPRASSLSFSAPWVGLTQLLRLATTARRAAELVDFGLAVLDGTRALQQTCTCERRGVACHCLDQLNDQDLGVWLRANGWQAENDAVVRGFYAGLFAREGELAAGVGLRAILRTFFDYRGAMVYRMEAGMGEVVVAPLYLALRKRGVRFKFLTRLGTMDIAGGRVKRLQFEALAEVPNDYEPYQTKLGVHGTLEYFPTTPPPGIRLPEAAPPGEAHRMHRRWPTGGPGLTIDVDAADHVILAIPPKAAKIAMGAFSQLPPWDAFFQGPTATQSRPIASAQLWRAVEDGNHPLLGAVAAGYALPFDVWADMSHLLPREGSQPTATELSYLCATSDASSATTQQAEINRVNALLDSWLLTETHYMLGGAGTEVRRSISASLAPSDEYVLSCPGTVNARPHPGETGVTNLSVAGDWVKTGLDCGCVESAVTGGMLAARAVP